MSNYLSSLAVFIGGGAGALLRFWMGQWLRANTLFTIPAHWATFGINLFASIALALSARYLDTKSAAWLLLGTGFCGGWSTYSTFSVEVTGLMHQGRTTEALLYVGASLLVILALVFLLHR